jgi:hypothetical protein
MVESEWLNDECINGYMALLTVLPPLSPAPAAPP